MNKTEGLAQHATKPTQYIPEVRDDYWKKSSHPLTTIVNGSFSNSATKNSPLWVQMKIYSFNVITLDLYEHSSSKPYDKTSEKPSYNFSLYACGKAICSNVRPEKYAGVNEDSHSEGINISGKFAEKMIQRLKTGDSCYISNEMGSSSSYTFSVNSKTNKEDFNSLQSI
jgi:hypothetical protein